MIACELNGANGKNALTARQRLSWIRNRPADASVQDRDAADDAVAYSKEQYPSLVTLFVDTAYAGKWAQRTHQMHAIDVQVIHGPNNRATGQWHS